jgi:hypothetical protein
VVKLTVVQRLGGWKSLEQLARYDHPEDPEMARAVEAIGQREPDVIQTAPADTAVVRDAPRLAARKA